MQSDLRTLNIKSFICWLQKGINSNKRRTGQILERERFFRSETKATNVVPSFHFYFYIVKEKKKKKKTLVPTIIIKSLTLLFSKLFGAKRLLNLSHVLLSLGGTHVCFWLSSFHSLYATFSTTFLTVLLFPIEMGCFMACFGLSNKRKRRKTLYKVLSGPQVSTLHSLFLIFNIHKKSSSLN